MEKDLVIIVAVPIIFWASVVLFLLYKEKKSNERNHEE